MTHMSASIRLHHLANSQSTCSISTAHARMTAAYACLGSLAPAVLHAQLMYVCNARSHI